LPLLSSFCFLYVFLKIFFKDKYYNSQSFIPNKMSSVIFIYTEFSLMNFHFLLNIVSFHFKMIFKITFMNVGAKPTFSLLFLDASNNNKKFQISVDFNETIILYKISLLRTRKLSTLNWEIIKNEWRQFHRLTFFYYIFCLYMFFTKPSFYLISFFLSYPRIKLILCLFMS
jgi:hypothetical protein